MRSPEEKQRFLDALWQTARERGDFPALSQSVKSIVTAMQEEVDDVDLTSAVLQDFSLTQKVIRLANSPMYAVFGGNVTTVTRALLILGQDTVGHVALSMKLLGSFDAATGGDEDKKRELSKAVLAGTVARGLAERVRLHESEEAAVCTLLHQVGRLMIVCYRPEMWRQICDRVEAGHPERESALVVLGVDFEEIGRMMAERWNLPVRIADTLVPVDPSAPSDPGDHSSWLRAVANAATELTAVLSAGGDVDPDAIGAIAERYAEKIGLEPEAILASAQSSVGSEQGTRLVAEAQAPRPALAVVGAAPPELPRDQIEWKLRSGLAEIRNAAGEMQLSALVNLVMETVYASLGASRIAFFMRDKTTKRIVARSGLGGDTRALLPQLSFPDAFAPDVFHLALANNRPVFIENVTEPTVARRLPQWYREGIRDARGFLLLPLCVNGRPLALLYADWNGTATLPQLHKVEIDLLAATKDVLLDAIVSSRARQQVGEARARA